MDIQQDVAESITKGTQEREGEVQKTRHEAGSVCTKGELISLIYYYINMKHISIACTFPYRRYHYIFHKITKAIGKF